LFDRLAGFAERRRRWIFVVAFLLLAVSGPLGGPVGGLLSAASSNFEDSGSESVEAREALEAAGTSPDVAVIALIETDGDVREDGRDRVEEVVDKLESEEAVDRVVTYFDTRDDAFVSDDGDSTYALVFYEPLTAEESRSATERILDDFEDEDGVLLGGPEVTIVQTGTQVQEDLAIAELLAFPILFLLSLVFFRGVVAALLPLVCGAVSILITFLALRIVNEITPLSIFALNLVTGLGLGLAIDYSLFIVSRYREELVRVGEGHEALRNTLATAGRTVAYSALTVAVALVALLIFPQPFLYSMGIGGILVALLSATTALVLLPAILAWLGRRVDKLSFARWREASARTARGERSGFWYRLSQAVMRRPIPIATGTAALLIFLGLPFYSVAFTDVDARILPEDASARQVHDALAAEFPEDRTTPIFVTVEGDRGAEREVEQYAETLSEVDGVAAVGEPQPVGDSLWRIDVIAAGDPLDDATQTLVKDLRDTAAPADAKFGGQTAAFVDQQDSLSSRLPLGILVLALGTFVLLFMMTGSVVLPIKALIMNLLTLSATFGILVFIFQDGRLEGLLDYTSLGALDATQPILLFVVAFALSTDYAVFLLGRIKEARDQGLDNTESVAVGLERTGRIVTAAAVLFAIAVGAFSTSEIVFIKQLGLGIALAVLIDATLVRALLVPSLMKLLGERNWWAPAPLKRLHAKIGLSEGG
jgi:RND superfamily putative drug exporter